jgi:two-component system C4-dicarboxylate transport response regulator DctD
VKRGAYDFLQKPADEDIILATLSRAIERRQLVLENRRLERQLNASRENRSRFHGLIGSHPSMVGLYSQIEAVAVEHDPVLIIGETGTGKELVARAIHDISHRSGAPYVAVNMGALPSEMIESELFGHEKGAFTGAIQRKVGKFEYAGEGTLFLDEICSMRVLEDRTFCRVGSNADIPLRARIIAASNRDLPAEIDRGAFRQDLYFRLNVLPVHLPPLRERKEDIPLLVEYFWNEYCDGTDRGARACTPALIRSLMAQEWPGNIRELRNAVRRYCILGEGEPPAAGTEADGDDLQAVVLPWKEYMDQQEQRYVEQVLRQVGGQVSTAHQVMGISRKSLYDKINKYGLELSRFRGDGRR